MRYGLAMLCVLAVACGGSDPDSSDLGTSEVTGDAMEPDLVNDPDAAMPDGEGDAPASDVTEVVTFACEPKPLTAIGNDFFVDISFASGIRVGNFVPTPQTPIPINDHSRLGFADINGDGFDDIVMHSLFPNPQKGIPFEHLVFINNHDKTFADFSDSSGLRDLQVAFFAFADIDNDGDQDCFGGLDIDPGIDGALT